MDTYTGPMTKPRPRIYDQVLSEHLQQVRQMAFVSGARQVGKTTTCRAAGEHYLSWDSPKHRQIILKGAEHVAQAVGLDALQERPVVIVLDELHKFSGWKNWLKGFFDLYEKRCRVVVTGSSRLDVYRRGGDSLMGRYFLYRMHPFSVAETMRTELPATAEQIIRPPYAVAQDDLEALWEHGGFPEPFIMRDSTFSRRWQKLRLEQLIREDIRELTRVQELGQIEVLGRLLQQRSGEQLIFAHLANEVRISQDTARRWVDLLCYLHMGFLLRPWYRNLSKALRKEPKWLLRDWSGIQDEGKRLETLVACHLLKAVEAWNDLGLADMGLFYIRDKRQREVDFVVVRDGQPWFLVEVKKTDSNISPALKHFHQELGTQHAFQVTWDQEYVQADCFSQHQALRVPATTFLSQLV